VRIELTDRDITDHGITDIDPVINSAPRPAGSEIQRRGIADMIGTEDLYEAMRICELPTVFNFCLARCP
jgi:hypothetical protein